VVRRHPSPALVVASLALFVALGGPAQAKRLIDGSDIKRGTIRSTQIKDGTIATRDLSRSAERTLRTPAAKSVTTARIADGAVTALQLGTGAVTGTKLAPGVVSSPAIADGSVGTADLADGGTTSAKLADGSVTGAKIADGSLTTADFARFAGRFRVAADSIGPSIAPSSCWSGEPRQLAPENAGADISADALNVTLRTPIADSWVSFSYRLSGANGNDPASVSRFVIQLCNVSLTETVPIPAGGLAFSYIVFDVP
jgi:hypothetical protein